MNNTLYVSLSHQMAMQRRLDVVSNNIANLNTTAYRRESVRFEEYITEMKGAKDPLGGSLSFVQDYGVVRDFQEGSFDPTGNPFDIAISGPGFLTVETPEGETRYTRNGHLKLDEGGRIVTSNGSLVMDDSGSEITLASGDTEINIAKDGTISGNTGRIARLALVEFSNPQALLKVGDSQYSTTEVPEDSENSTILQGMIEGSNVNGVEEVTNMVQILRSYQKVAQMLSDYQKLRQSAIQRLARVA
jgi:flagellar basal-body rod protein FlgF